MLLLIGILSIVELSGNTVIGVGRSSGEAEAQVVTPVSLATGIELVGMQLDLGYNPAALSIVGVDVAAGQGSGYEVVGAEVGVGRYRILVYSERNLAFLDGDVLGIELEMAAGVAEGARGIELLEVQLADAGGVSRNYQLAPYVEILTPLETAQRGEAVALEVGAYAAVGELTDVKLYANGTLVGTQGEGPYRFNWVPGMRGRTELLVVATDATQVEARVAQTVQVLSNFDRWAAGQFPVEQIANPFVAGFGADGDGDGVANAIEYLAGGDPYNALDGGTLETGLMEEGGAYYLTLSLEVEDSVDDVGYRVYAGNKLDVGDSGAQAAVLVEEVARGGGRSLKVYRDPVPIGQGGRYMYVRAWMDAQ